MDFSAFHRCLRIGDSVSKVGEDSYNWVGGMTGDDFNFLQRELKFMYIYMQYRRSLSSYIPCSCSYYIFS